MNPKGKITMVTALEIGYASTRGATGLLNRRKIIIEQSKVF
jgi:hypothetical protein